MLNATFWLLAMLFGFLCVFLILLILIQKGRGGGLSGAFGGAGGNTAFGTKTGDLLTWVTSVVFGVLLLLTMGLTWTSDAIHARETGTAGAPQVVSEDPFAAEVEGAVNVMPPDEAPSPSPAGVATPEPGIPPEAAAESAAGAGSTTQP